MDGAVVIPWRAGCPHRLAALGWVTARHEHAGRTVRLGEVCGAGWCKARATDAAMPTSGIVVIADADVWCDGLDEAIAAVRSGAPWAIPHGNVRRLAQDATGQVLAGTAPSRSMPLAQRAYRGHAGGGIVVTTADVWQDCPLDPRFIGWGHEDDSWAAALKVLAGEPWRGTADLWHLWHPPQERRSRTTGRRESVALARRYRTARHDIAAMRSLADEARRLLEVA